MIVGHNIPAGTGLNEYDSIIVGSKSDHELMNDDNNGEINNELKKKIMKDKEVASSQ